MNEKLVLTARTVWSVYSNTDLTDGRGSSYRESVHLTQHAAAQAAVGKGVMGTPADVKQEIGYITQDESRVYFLGKSMALSESEKEKEKLEEVMKKLNNSDREVLERYYKRHHGGT